MAVFSAWLSSKMAPRMERSASRLLGSGRSSVVSADIGSFKLFAFSSLYSTLPRAMQDFRSLLGLRTFFSKLDFCIVRVCARGVNGNGCAWFRKTLQNFFALVCDGGSA